MEKPALKDENIEDNTLDFSLGLNSSSENGSTATKTKDKIGSVVGVCPDCGGALRHLEGCQVKKLLYVITGLSELLLFMMFIPEFTIWSLSNVIISNILEIF